MDSYFCQANSIKYHGMFEVKSPEKIQVREKGLSQHVEYMQVPNGTGQGIFKSKCLLSACYTCRKYSMQTYHKSVKGRVW